MINIMKKYKCQAQLEIDIPFHDVDMMSFDWLGHSEGVILI